MFRRLLQLLLTISSIFLLNGTVLVHAESVNPYSGGYYNCTWTAWQLAYDKLGVAMPNFGDAGNWYSRAGSLGYWVDQTPSSNSVVVWSGHVGYVDEYDPTTNMMFVEQGGMQIGSGGYWAGWMNVGRSLGGQELYGFIHFYDAPVLYSGPSAAWSEEAQKESDAEANGLPSIEEQEIEARRVAAQRMNLAQVMEDLRPMINTYEIRADIPTEQIEEMQTPMMVGIEQTVSLTEEPNDTPASEEPSVPQLHFGSPEGEADIEVKKPLRLG